MESEPLKDVEEAKELYRNNPIFNRFVNAMIVLLKERTLTAEQVLTGCTLAVGEYEYHEENRGS